MSNRNEPCPCGSGRKYKKCCLAAENQADQERRDELTRAVADDFARGQANLTLYTSELAAIGVQLPA